MEYSFDEICNNVAEFQSHNDEIIAENRELEKELEAMRNNLEEYESYQKVFCNEIDEATAVVDRLTEENFQLRTQLEFIEKDIHQMDLHKQDFEQMQNRIHKLENEKVAGERKHEQLLMNQEALEMCLQEKGEVAVSLENDLKDLSQCIYDLEKQHSVLIEERNDLTREQHEVKICLRDTEMKVYNENQYLKEDERVTLTLGDELALLEQYLKETEDMITNEKRRNDMKEQELNKLQMEKCQLEMKRETVQRELEDCENHLQQVLTNIARVKHEHENLINGIKDLKKDLVYNRCNKSTYRALVIPSSFSGRFDSKTRSFGSLTSLPIPHCKHSVRDNIRRSITEQTYGALGSRHRRTKTAPASRRYENNIRAMQHNVENRSNLNEPRYGKYMRASDHSPGIVNVPRFEKSMRSIEYKAGNKYNLDGTIYEQNKIGTEYNTTCCGSTEYNRDNRNNLDSSACCGKDMRTSDSRNNAEATPLRRCCMSREQILNQQRHCQSRSIQYS